MGINITYPQYEPDFITPIAKLQIKIAEGMIADLKKITPVSPDKDHLRDTWTYRQTIIKNKNVQTFVWGGENYRVVHLIQNGTVKMAPRMNMNPVIRKWTNIYVDEMAKIQPDLNEEIITIKQSKK